MKIIKEVKSKKKSGKKKMLYLGRSKGCCSGDVCRKWMGYDHEQNLAIIITDEFSHEDGKYGILMVGYPDDCIDELYTDDLSKLHEEFYYPW